MRKNNKYGYIPILVGALLLLVVLNIGGEGRARPVYDQDATQDFRLSFVSHDDPVVAGSNTEIVVNVVNRGESGTMYVQCSILNLLAEGEFLARAVEINYLSPYDNCVNPEPFTQTAQVYLSRNEEARITYTVRAPTDLFGEYVFYCEAFERCWSPSNENTGSTSQIVRDARLVEPTTPPITEDTGVPATDDDFLDEELGVDSETPGTVTYDWSNIGIRGWLQENSMLAMMIAIVLLIIGGVLVYSEPKKNY